MKNAIGLEENRREYLVKLHGPLQKILILFCAPVVLFAFGMWFFVNPAWQSAVLFSTCIGMIVSWTVGHRLMSKEQLNLSVSFFIIPVVLQTSLVFLLLKGAGISALWSSLSATVYAGLFSKRKLYFAAIVTVLFSTLGHFIEVFDIYQKQDATVAGALIPVAAINVMSCAVMVYFLRRSQTINENLFAEIAEKSTDQSRVISTFRRLQPEVTGAVNTISGIAASIAAQSQEQAAAADQISATLEFIKDIAVDTNVAAADTLEMASHTRQESLKSSDLIRASEKKFQDVHIVVAESAKKTTSLANQLDSIDEILAFNRQIAQQLQILAINASIEADCAGEYGKGFGAVAAEFKEMVQSTEENLNRSTQLLHGIRDQSRESAQTIVSGSNQLSQYFQDLQTTGRTIEQNAESFLRTADSVASISDSAKQQQTCISQVSVAMSQLTDAAIHLQKSTAQMIDELNKIVTSQLQLKATLDQISLEAEKPA